MKGICLYLALSFSLVSGAALAEGVSIEPGLWEMTSTVKMPMLPQPRVSTSTECIEETELSPEIMREDDMDPSCTIGPAVADGNTMRWSMDCNEQGGDSHIEWEVTSHGDTMAGEGTVTVDMQGQSMVMSMEWAGKRIGDCN